MSKHAYLIMAHNEFSLLKKLLMLLDDPRNDIYVHVDKKAKGFGEDNLRGICRSSKIVFLKKEKVSWGAYSQINCELNLLKEATKKYYDYYHLLSGVDLPIKKQDDIHQFFTEHAGYEFLNYQHEAMEMKRFLSRIQFYHFFQEIIGHHKNEYFLYGVNRILLKLQKILRINRIRKTNIDFKKGTSWFSITHDLANYVVDQEDVVKRQYRYTQCADEIFLHTLIWNSDYREKLIENNKRYIDWKRGRPYTFRNEDYDLLIDSDCFWARKFSEQIDKEIIERIFTNLLAM